MRANSLQELIQNKPPSDPSILNFQNSKINKIGIIPSKLTSELQILNLANNNLRSLEGIQQFTKLQSLDLSNNKIVQSESIIALKKLLHLKKLYLKGNPFLENPLNEEILAFLSSFQNDLQILNYAFVDPDRQTLVNEHRRSKSKSRISRISESKKTRMQQEQQNLSRGLRISKTPKKSKPKLLINIDELIQEKHEAQEQSHNSIDIQDQLSKKKISPLSSQNQKNLKDVSPIKAHQISINRSPKFGLSPIAIESVKKSEARKFREESTDFKGKHLMSSKVNELSYQSRTPNRYKQPSQPNFKYQVSNLKINMDLEKSALNYPSITEREDQDSYEIQFDFMSPKKSSLSGNKNMSPQLSPSKLQLSPSKELKEITASYMKIQQNSIPQQIEEIEKKKQNQASALPEAKKNQILPPTPKLTQVQHNLLREKISKIEKKLLQNAPDKQNVFQKTEQKLNFLKKGSLSQSVRYVVPQTNQSKTHDIIRKLLNHKITQQCQSFSTSFSLQEMMDNTQKFEKFYYASLVRLKPTFSLLYSPFSSLKTDQKDLLLQELFKSHKQIFILLLKQFHSKDQIQNQLQSKNFEIEQAKQQISYFKFVQERLRQYQNINNIQKQKIARIQLENRRFKKHTDQFQDILASRQKIINDMRNQYEKANKLLIKKEQIVQKILNQDQIEEQIMIKIQNKLKSQYLKIINKKASKVSNLYSFIQKRKIRQKNREEKNNLQLKRIIFEGFRSNQKRQTNLKRFISNNQRKMLEIQFNQWNHSVKISKVEKKLQKTIQDNKKSLAYLMLRNFHKYMKIDKKARLFKESKLKRNAFFLGFKQNYTQSQIKYQEYLKRSIQLRNKNIIKEYFLNLKSAKSKLSLQRVQNQLKIKKNLILKRQFPLLRKISKYLQKQELAKIYEVQQNIIRQNERKFFFKKLRARTSNQTNYLQKLKKSENYRARRIFNFFKKNTKKNIKQFLKFQKISRKLAHELRIKKLIIQFKQKRISDQLDQEKKCSFVQKLRFMYCEKQMIAKKKDNLLVFLEYRRKLKAQNIFLSELRHQCLRSKMRNKQLNISDHYLLQQLKYKQSHELNLVTIQQLKNQINMFAGEIQFYKIQVQKLSQRELLIMEEKDSCLLEMKCKQQQNFQLRRAISEYEKKLEELQRKYLKSLDMYAVAIGQANQREIKSEKKNFFYDTYDNMSEGLFPLTFRKQILSPPYGSSKR